MERRAQYETWPADPAAPPLPADAPLYFDASIRPNRSLPNPGFYVLMGVLVIVSFCAGIAFVSIGAWPVIGFFGLDVLLVWLAFRMSYRDGRRLETVQVTAEEIRVARRTPFGHVTAYRVPLAWTRVELAGRGEPDVQARLSHKGRSLIIGAMLSPKERESLAEAVRGAIEKARRGAPFEPPQEPGGAAV
ncbi:MAG: DUF2244 domain-containing protein [Oceanicaulis sp.]